MMMMMMIIMMMMNTNIWYFQIHTRHVYCSGRAGTCNCAVAVREGNDILGIYACDGRVTLIRYLRDPNTPPGKADIKLWWSWWWFSLYIVGSYVFNFLLKSAYFLSLCASTDYCFVAENL